MKPFNYEKAREFLEQKENDRNAIIKKRFKQATHDFDVITKEVVSRYNPSKIYQWGSLLNEQNFSDISDIDIALEGICSADEMFEIYGLAMELTNFPVDIVQIEKIEPEFAALIKKNGKLIYER